MTFSTFTEYVPIVGLSGIVGTLLALVVKAILERRSQNHEHEWQEEKELRERTQDTDRATYNHRLTILVREYLAAFIRTGSWPTDKEDLRRLLASLSQKSYEHFLDPAVNQRWELLVRKSVEFAAHRLSNRITESDIREYNRLRTEWEDDCKRSFGPLPPTPEDFVPRRDPRKSVS